MYSQLRQFPELLVYFMHNRTPVIHLIRRNYFDIVISTEMARSSGHWHQVGEQASSKASAGKRQVQLNPLTLISQLRWLQRKNQAIQRFIQWSRLPYLEIFYEDLLSDTTSFHQFWTFLGIRGQRQMPQSNLSKIRRASYHDTIENYHEVEPVLTASEFSKLLQE